jgi:hypothetical protein
VEYITTCGKEKAFILGPSDSPSSETLKLVWKVGPRVEVGGLIKKPTNWEGTIGEGIHATSPSLEGLIQDLLLKNGFEGI